MGTENPITGRNLYAVTQNGETTIADSQIISETDAYLYAQNPDNSEKVLVMRQGESLVVFKGDYERISTEVRKQIEAIIRKEEGITGELTVVNFQGIPPVPRHLKMNPDGSLEKKKNKKGLGERLKRKI